MRHSEVKKRVISCLTERQHVLSFKVFKETCAVNVTFNFKIKCIILGNRVGVAAKFKKISKLNQIPHTEKRLKLELVS